MGRTFFDCQNNHQRSSDYQYSGTSIFYIMFPLKSYLTTPQHGNTQVVINLQDYCEAVVAAPVWIDRKFLLYAERTNTEHVRCKK